MEQQEISVVNQRSPYAGDPAQGNIRIKQIIEAEGKAFEIYTNKEGGVLVVYENQEDRVRACEFAIKETGSGVPWIDVPWIDLVRQKIMKKTGENGYSDIDDVGYSENDGTGVKGIRNNLVLPQDTMINDVGRITTHADLETSHSLEFKVARFALQQQQVFIRKLSALFDGASIQERS